MQTNSRVVSESLESYAAGLLAESASFSALSAGEADPGHVRDVFGQYYLWRNRFHRWFGICVAKSAPVDDALNVPRVLTELIAWPRAQLARHVLVGHGAATAPARAAQPWNTMPTLIVRIPDRQVQNPAITNDDCLNCRIRCAAGRSGTGL